MEGEGPTRAKGLSGPTWEGSQWPETLERANIHTGGFDDLRIAWRGCLKFCFSGHPPPPDSDLLALSYTQGSSFSASLLSLTLVF